MRLADSIRIASQGVRRRPLRNVLTAVSLLVGVLTIVLIQGGSTSIRNSIVLDSTLQNGPSTTMQVSIAPAADQFAVVDDWQRMLSTITADKSGHAAATVQAGNVQLYVGGQAASNITVLVVDVGLRAIRPFQLITGGWFTTTSPIEPQLVLNQAAWNQMNWVGRPAEMNIGQTLERQRLQVVGVVYDGSSTPDAYLNIADPEVRKDAMQPTDQVQLLVYAPGVGENELRSRIVTLAAVSGRSAEIGDVQRVDRIDDYSDQIRTTTRIFLGIAALSLLVGSLGILNIGLATLKERAEELSLRRSFGASRRDVVLIMVLESLIIAAGAATAAVVIAAVGLPMLITRIGSAHQILKVGLPLGAVLIGVVASVVAALLGALAPTVRAARIPISSIMRG